MEKTMVKLARIEEGIKSIKSDISEIKNDMKEKNTMCYSHSRQIGILRRDFKWAGFFAGAVGSFVGLVIGIIFDWYNKKGV